MEFDIGKEKDTSEISIVSMQLALIDLNIDFQ